MARWDELSRRAKIFASIAAGVTGGIAAFAAVSTAWAALELPYPVMSIELAKTRIELTRELRDQSVRIARSDIDSRGRQISQDTLTLSILQEKADGYHQKGEPIPEWLHRQIQGTTETIEYNKKQREDSTKQMEKDSHH
jgi:hypothetical protein